MKKYAKFCVISLLCLTLLPAQAFFAAPKKPVPDIPVSLNPIDTAKAIAQQVREAAQRVEEAIRLSEQMEQLNEVMNAQQQALSNQADSPSSGALPVSLPEERPFAPLTDYGILQDRFAALATDGIRAKLLEEAGYETRILEFIDMEHTPKNLLIRAVKGPVSAGRREAAGKEVDALCRQFGFVPCLRELLRGRE